MTENQNVEWKKVWKDEYLQWICGFANAQGGRIYIGCDDDGKVVGLNNFQKLMEDIPNKITQSLGVVADVNLLEENGLKYIEIVVPPYTTGVTYKGVYHYRSGATKQVLSGLALEQFLNSKRGVTWDSMPLPAFRMSDVDDGLVERFRKLASEKGRINSELLNEPKEVLMEQLHLKAGDYLTNAAMMLFAKDPEEWQLGAYVKIGYFESDSELVYQDEIRGSILELADKVVELVYLKYMKAKISYVGMQRQERYFVPEEALREAVLNALCHTQYNYGVPIQISVYEDCLYIANCGCLPPNWTLENLMGKHASRPYNPNIAHVLYLAGYIESWGRGIEKICESCRRDGLPAPQFTINPGDIMVKFSAPADRVVRTYMHEPEDDYVLTEREAEVLRLLIRDPGFTYEGIASELSVSRKTVSERIKSLKDKKAIVRSGSDTKGHWVVKDKYK